MIKASLLKVFFRVCYLCTFIIELILIVLSAIVSLPVFILTGKNFLECTIEAVEKAERYFEIRGK